MPLSLSIFLYSLCLTASGRGIRIFSIFLYLLLFPSSVLKLFISSFLAPLLHQGMFSSDFLFPFYLLSRAHSQTSVTSPTSKLILQPFRRFTYITAHSPTLLLLHLRPCHSPTLLSLLLRHKFFT